MFQKGPQVTALVTNLPGLNVRNSMELRQSLPMVKSRHSDHSKSLTETKNPKEIDFSSDSASNSHHRSKTRQKHQGFQLTGSTTSLNCRQTQLQSQLQRRKPSRVESAMEQLSKNCKNALQAQPVDFDSEPTYYRLQV